MPKGRATNQAVKLMIIRDYLYSHTNENHWVTSKDIIAHLESHEIRADRKTIFSDIKRLEDDYKLKIVHAGRKGYRIENPLFEARELRMMIDSVQSAKFITESEAATITSKIKDLADVYTSKTLDRKAYVSERVEDKGESVVGRTDTIHKAIYDDTNISFKYGHIHPSMSREQILYSLDGKRYKVSPFALYWNNGNYYLYAFVPDKGEFRFFRIDRMEDIKQEKAKREGHEQFSDKNLRGRRKAKVFDMYSTGKEVTVTLQCANRLADQVTDTFGRGAMLVPNGNGYFTVNALVDVSPTFYAWVATFEGAIRIIAPDETKSEMRKYLEKMLKDYI